MSPPLRRASEVQRFDAETDVSIMGHAGSGISVGEASVFGRLARRQMATAASGLQ